MSARSDLSAATSDVDDRRRAARRGQALPPFELVVAEHGPAVLRFCIARSGAHAGEDAFQETMISALRAYPELRDPGAVRGWLFSIAHRKTIDAGRAEQRRPRPAGAPAEVEAVAGMAGGPGQSARPTLAEASSGSGGHVLIDRSGAAEAWGHGSAADPLAGTVWVHVRALPAKQREAVTLRYLADLTNTEIASVMATSPEAARRNVFEGLRRLRTLVGDDPA